MSLCWYNIQTLTLPFSTHHSPSLRLDDLNNYGRDTTKRLHYWRTPTKDNTNYWYIFPSQLIYFVGPHIFIPGLDEFFYRPVYGSASSLGSGWVRGSKGSTSNTFEGGGAGGIATSVLLFGGWIGIPSKIMGSCLSATSVLRLALVTR